MLGLFKKKLLIHSTLPDVSIYHDPSSSYFYYTSTNQYDNFVKKEKKFTISFYVFLSIILISEFSSIDARPAIAFKKELPVLCDIFNVLSIPAVWVVTIAAAFIINAEFFKRFTLDDIVLKNKNKLNVVKSLVKLSIKASEVEQLCSAKKGCWIFDNSRMCCTPNPTRCNEMDADPIKEFPGHPDGDDQSCQLIKRVHREYLTIREEIADCYSLTIVHFPELIEVIKFQYKNYYVGSDKYWFIPFAYCNFFDSIMKIPFTLAEEYKEDKQFLADVKKIFENEYTDYQAENKPGTWSEPGFPLSIHIKTDDVFYRFDSLFRVNC